MGAFAQMQVWSNGTIIFSHNANDVDSISFAGSPVRVQTKTATSASTSFEGKIYKCDGGSSYYMFVTSNSGYYYYSGTDTYNFTYTYSHPDLTITYTSDGYTYTRTFKVLDRAIVTISYDNISSKPFVLL